MPSFEEELAVSKQLVDAIKQKLNEMRIYGKRELAHEFYKEIDYKKIAALWAECAQMESDLRSFVEDESLALLPPPMLSTLRDGFNNLADAMHRIHKHLTEREDVRDRHVINARIDENARHLLGVYNNVRASIAPTLGYLAIRSPRVRAELLAAREKIADLLEELGAQRDEAAKAAAAAKTDLAEIRGIKPEAAVAQHEKNFDQTATDHASKATHWLWATLGTGVVLVVGIYEGLKVFGVKEDADRFTPFVIQNLIAKAVVVSILYYAGTVCLRNYRVHRHLAVVNAHRRNALKTFQTFATAAKDDQTRAAVLLEATKCIFAPASTGYTAPDEEVTPPKLLELIKGAGKGSA